MWIKLTQASVAPLLAIGLYNTLTHAKQEEDLARRDALLEESCGNWPRNSPDDV